MPSPRFGVRTPLVLLIVLACGRPGARADSTGTRFAANAAPAWKDGHGWKLASTPLSVIGEADGAPAYQLGHVWDAVVISDTVVVIADRGTRQVRYFSTRGNHLRTVGGTGDGPGEFRWIDWMGERGDTVVVWDSFAARVTLLRPDGTVARTLRVVAAAHDVHPAVGLLPDGSLVLRVPTPQAEIKKGKWIEPASYLRVSTIDGAKVGQVGPLVLGERFTRFEGRNSVTANVIFGRRGIVATAPSGVLTGTGDHFELTLRHPDGTPVRTIGRRHSPTAASASVIEAYRQQLVNTSDLATIDPMMAQVQRRLFAELPHRDTLPAITRALVDGRGNVWMEEFRIDEKATGTWSVFDPGGRWLGQVQTPAGVKVLSISHNAVLGLTKDEDDIEHVVVYPLLR